MWHGCQQQRSAVSDSYDLSSICRGVSVTCCSRCAVFTAWFEHWNFSWMALLVKAHECGISDKIRTCSLNGKFFSSYGRYIFTRYSRCSLSTCEWDEAEAFDERLSLIPSSWVNWSNMSLCPGAILSATLEAIQIRKLHVHNHNLINGRVTCNRNGLAKLVGKPSNGTGCLVL